MYGPTETTIYSVCSQVNSNICKNDKGSVSIGRPIDNTQVYVLDKNEQLAAIGVIGELYIGGRGIARGYLNKGSLTATKFIPNQLSLDPGARIYKTGDLVRYLANGELEFLGRIDNQIKIRGFRIELGEIESNLLQHEHISEARIVALQNGQLDKYLVAYVVSEWFKQQINKQELERQHKVQNTLIDECKAHLRCFLPDYMVPATFVFIEKMPLTPSGKVDKNALPLPDESDLQKEQYVAARNWREEKLCLIWQELLSLQQVGIYDNFFSLGGHSLLATRLMSSIRQQFNKELPLHVLFELPTIAGLSESLRVHDDEFVLPPVKARTRSQTIPLSYAQQRIWFIDQLEEGSLQYIMAGRFSLKGEFEKKFFIQALQSFLERHEILRTHYKSVEGRAQQVIAKDFELPFTQYDFSHLDENSKKISVQNLIRQESKTSFDLTKDLMLRVKLVKLATHSHLILYSMHHIACDGWSLRILRNELSALYDAYSQQNIAQIDSLKVQYADYAIWQRQWLQGEVLEKQLDYWGNQLAGIPAIHNLPLDKPRPAQQSFEGEVHHQLIEEEALDKISGFCKRYEVTLFMFMQTVFSVLVGRYSNETDIVIGTPISGRNHRDLENVIGFFVNSLVLRTDLSNNPAFEHLLKANKKNILDAYDYQDIPFEMLVEKLNVTRSLSYHPILQIYLNFDETVDLKLALKKSDLNKADETHVEQENKTDLTLYVRRSSGQLLLSWSFLSSLFNYSTIVRMAASLDCIIKQIIHDCEIPVQSLKLADDECDLSNLPFQHGRDKKDNPRVLVHEKIEQLKEMQSDAIAISHRFEQITYAQLDRRATELSKVLLSRISMQGTVVLGVFIKRSIEMVVAILGILKSGFAYAPLALELPRGRIHNMIRESNIKTILTLSTLQNCLPKEVHCLLLDKAFDTSTSKETEARATHPESASHVIFTSGSTGSPKGVVGTHASLANRIQWMNDTFSYNAGEIACQITASGFIRAVWELFTPLCQGVKVVIVDTDEVRDPVLLAKVVGEQNITRIVTAPSLARELVVLPNNHNENLKKLTYWFVSGESLSVELTNRILSRLPNTQLCNLYGSTEVMSDVSYHCVKKNTYPTSIPIGIPIDNTSLYVLDFAKNILPVKVPGELHVGGDSLAIGYVNDEELTNQKFVNNPFANVTSDRLYRTGDIVRWLEDGNLEYLGRVDEQVKIRGFRIEPAEIESQLLQIEMTKSAVVLVRENTEKEKRLVAYIVLCDVFKEREENQEEDLVVHALSEQQRKRLISDYKARLELILPDYMTQLVYVFLNRLPKKPNGKVDRNLLPKPEEKYLQKESYQAPENGLERTLCQLWQQLLKVERVGVYDDFFALGGHSLLATRLISLIRQEFAIELPLRALFESPNVSGLSYRMKAYLDQQKRNSIEKNNNSAVVEEGEI